MFRKYETDYNPKIDFKVINLLNPKHDVINNYFEKVKIFKYDAPSVSEQGRWFKKIKNIYIYLVENQILTVDSFVYAAKELESEVDYEKVNKIVSCIFTGDAPKDSVWLLKEIWKEKPIGTYSYVLAVLAMNSFLKKNHYIPMIFIDRYNSFINKMIDENITYESLFYILSIFEDMSLKYVDKYDLIDKKTVISRIVNNKDTLITDKNIPVKNFKWWYGLYNGKLIVNTLNNLPDDMIVIPVRNLQHNVNKPCDTLIIHNNLVYFNNSEVNLLLPYKQ